MMHDSSHEPRDEVSEIRSVQPHVGILVDTIEIKPNQIPFGLCWHCERLAIPVVGFN